MLNGAVLLVPKLTLNYQKQPTNQQQQQAQESRLRNY